jgi:hypothetical protein
MHFFMSVLSSRVPKNYNLLRFTHSNFTLQTIDYCNNRAVQSCYVQ